MLIYMSVGQVGAYQYWVNQKLQLIGIIQLFKKTFRVSTAFQVKSVFILERQMQGDKYKFLIQFCRKTVNFKEQSSESKIYEFQKQIVDLILVYLSLSPLEKIT